MDSAAPYRFHEDPFCRDPDCLRCMRQKLKALGLVVFFREADAADAWRIGNFQGDKPQEAAQAEFEYMLKCGVPEIIAKRGSFILTNAQDIKVTFPKLKEFFKGCSLIAAHVKGGESSGVRLAWRENSEPFSEKDLEIIRCSGNCPSGCEPA